MEIDNLVPSLHASRELISACVGKLPHGTLLVWWGDFVGTNAESWEVVTDDDLGEMGREAKRDGRIHVKEVPCNGVTKVIAETPAPTAEELMRWWGKDSLTNTNPLWQLFLQGPNWSEGAFAVVGKDVNLKHEFNEIVLKDIATGPTAAAALCEAITQGLNEGWL